MTRGRPAVKPTVPLLLWVMVELMRDRKEGVARGRGARAASAASPNIWPSVSRAAAC